MPRHHVTCLSIEVRWPAACTSAIVAVHPGCTHARSLEESTLALPVRAPRRLIRHQSPGGVPRARVGSLRTTMRSIPMEREVFSSLGDRENPAGFSNPRSLRGR